MPSPPRIIPRQSKNDSNIHLITFLSYKFAYSFILSHSSHHKRPTYYIYEWLKGIHESRESCCFSYFLCRYWSCANLSCWRLTLIVHTDNVILPGSNTNKSENKHPGRSRDDTTGTYSTFYLFHFSQMTARIARSNMAYTYCFELPDLYKEGISGRRASTKW